MAYRKKELHKQPDTSASTPAGNTPLFPGSGPPSSASLPDPGPSNLAQQKFHSGFQNLWSWSTKVSRSASGQQMTPSPDTGPLISSAQNIEARAQSDVEAELLMYLSHPRVSDDISACVITIG